VLLLVLKGVRRFWA